jgi:hypothetical protein
MTLPVLVKPTETALLFVDGEDSSELVQTASPLTPA